MQLYVIVPTYNEKDNLPKLLEQLLVLPVDLKVINVDDGSPDGTGAIADEWAAKDSRVIAVHRLGKLGLGTAYIAGYRKAFSLDATHVLTMDADFSHNPKYIPSMIAKAQTGFD